MSSGAALRRGGRCWLLLVLVLRAAAAAAGGSLRLVQQRLVADELVAVLLEDRAGEGLAAQHVDGLAEFPELVDQRNEVAVAADDGEGVDVVVREGHLESVEGQVDVGAVLVAARRGDALHHLDGVGGHLPRGAFLPGPVGVGELGDDVAALLQRVERHRNVELALQRDLDADLDVVVIDKHRNIHLLLHDFLVPSLVAPGFMPSAMTMSLISLP